LNKNQEVDFVTTLKIKKNHNLQPLFFSVEPELQLAWCVIFAYLVLVFLNHASHSGQDIRAIYDVAR
jgi:hypothetical protein